MATAWWWYTNSWSSPYLSRYIKNCKKQTHKLGMVVHVFNPSTGETEAGGYLCLRPAWSPDRISGQPVWLHRENPSWKENKEQLINYDYMNIWNRHALLNVLKQAYHFKGKILIVFIAKMRIEL